MASRYWSRVRIGEGCWEWQGARDADGYGQFKHRNKQIKAHRFMWRLVHGKPPPSDILVLHSCDNPPCVKPNHLFLGTHSDNMADSVAKGRRRNQWHKIPQSDHTTILRRIEAGETKSSIAREYGVRPSRIWAIQKGGATP